jgi:SAM-dependent methyltransferase
LPADDTFEFRGYAIPVRLCNLTGGGPATFEAIALAHIRNINSACGLRHGMNVVEVGCGIGRDAIPLTEIPGPDGRYIGIDVIAESIQWCSNNITARHPNFTFVHQDIQDDLHNPSGTIDVLAISLPVPDCWCDLIILQSVFTHMLRDTVFHYLNEFRRVIQPRGLIYATVFLVDDEILASARETNLTEWNLRFEHSAGVGVYINDLDHPTGAVAYREDVLDELVEDAGLRPVGPIRRGAWSGSDTLAFDAQDVLVLRPMDRWPQ